MREISQSMVDLLNSPAYSASTRVYIMDSESNWAEVTDLMGYDWVRSLNFSIDVDNTVEAGSLELYRNFYYLSLSPTVESSKINRDSTGEVFTPLLDVARRIRIDVAIHEENVEAADEDYFTLFEGEIQDIDWSGRESVIDVTFHGMLARIRDAFMEEETTYGGVGFLIEDVSSGSNTVKVRYEEDIDLAEDASEANDQEKEWNRIDKFYMKPSHFSSKEETFTVQTGDKVICWLDDGFLSGAELKDANGDVVFNEPLNRSNQEVVVSSGQAGTWTAKAVSYFSRAEISVKVFRPKYPRLGVGKRAVISNMEHNISNKVAENVTIADVSRITSTDEDEEHDYLLTLEAPLDNSYDKISDDGTSGAYVGIEVVQAMNDVLDDMDFGYNDWDIDIYEEHYPDFVVKTTDLGHESALDAINSFADQLGWIVEYRWWDSVEEFRATLRDPEREKILGYAPADPEDPEGETFTGTEIPVTTTAALNVGDEVCFIDSDKFETDVIESITEADYETGDRATITLETGLSETYSYLATIARYDFIVSPDNYLEVTQLEVDKTVIRNVCKAGYQKYQTREPKSEDDLGEAWSIDDDSVQRYGRLFMEVTQKASPGVAGAVFANQLVNNIVDDLAFPKAAQETDLRLMPYVQLGDVLVFEPDGEYYDTHQVYAVTGYNHDFAENITSVRTRGKPAGGFLKWHKMDTRPGGAPAVRGLSPVTDLIVSVDYESDDEGDPIVPLSYKVDLTWKNPVKHHSYFEIRHKKLSDNNWHINSTDSIGYKLRNLEPDRQYSIGVRVISSQGGEDSTVRRSAWTSKTIDLSASAAQHVTNVEWQDVVIEDKSGVKTTYLEVTWTPPDRSFYRHSDVYYREPDTTSWRHAKTGFDSVTFRPALSYDFSSESFSMEMVIITEDWYGNRLGFSDAYVYLVTLEGNIVGPSLAQFEEIRWGADGIEMTWSPHEDPDFDQYEVRLDDDFGSNR